MFEPSDITNVFLYFKLFLVILAVVPYLMAVKRATPFWFKHALGAEVLVVILSVFNLVLLFRQSGLGLFWDVLNLILGAFLFYKIRILLADAKGKGLNFVSIFWSFAFWLIGLLYVMIFPLGFTPLK